MAILLAAAALPACAADSDDRMRVLFSTTMTIGTSIRTEGRDPSTYGAVNGNSVGVRGGITGGGAGTLNFDQGRPFSTVVKAVSELELGYRQVGAFVRGKAWHDHELDAGERRYGNHVNGFARGVPLGDDTLRPLARFSGARLLDAFAYAQLDMSGHAVSTRIGRQVVSWGEALLTGGGINIINPVDVSAFRRPGAQLREGLLPVGMAYANVALAPNFGLEGLYQYEWRPTELEACGSFFSTTDFIVPGCDGANVLSGLGLSDYDVFHPGSQRTLPGTSIPAFGTFAHRAGDRRPRDTGQYGFALRYIAPARSTEIAAYLVKYHSRLPHIEVLLPTSAEVLQAQGLPGIVTRLRSPNGAFYRAAFPEDIALAGASISTSVGPVALFAEMSRRRRQPITLNAADLIAAFVTRAPNAALQVARNVNSLPVGATFRGYDLFEVTTSSVAVVGQVPGLLASSAALFTGEVALSRVHGLPDPAFVRYGRSDAYGTARVGTLACDDVVPARTCALDGFVTTDSWGYRLRGSLQYPGLLGALTLTPSVAWSHDVRGYSYDGTFAQGRRAASIALRGEYTNRYFAEIAYTRYFGGDYNGLVDRDFAAVSFGASF